MPEYFGMRIVLAGRNESAVGYDSFRLGAGGDCHFFFGEKLSDYGIARGDWRAALCPCFVASFPLLLVIGFLAGSTPAFFDVYPYNETLRVRNLPSETVIPYGLFVLHIFLYLTYYAGWEFLFRGFLQHGLTGSIGLVNAVLVQTVFSSMLHFGHPPGEVIGAVLGGLFWGWLAARTRSLLAGFVQHALLGFIVDAVLVYG